jgi:hypothetical protein
MYKDNIGVATPRGIQRLARSLRYHFDGDAGLLLHDGQ